MKFFLQTIPLTLDPWKLIGLFLIIVLPVIFSPFMTDDYYQLLLLGSNTAMPHPNDGSLWGLFSFIDNSEQSRDFLISQGALPWWTSDEFYFRFWRPLAEITHRVDYIIAPGNPVWAHLHSVLWFIALSLIVFRLALLISGDRTLSYIVMVLFVLDGNHASSIAWIANRNAIISACFAFLCLYNHILFRQRSGPAFQVFACVWLVLGLFAGESAVAIGFYLFSYALFLDKKGFIKGFLALLPYALAVALWYWKYRSLGFGANGSDIHYVDMAAMPLQFLSVLVERAPIYIASAFYLIPAEIYPAIEVMGGEAWQQKLWWIVVGGLALLLALFLPVIKKNPLLKFALLASVMSLIPFCAIVNQDRLVLIPSMGFDFAIVLLAYALLKPVQNMKPFAYQIAKKMISIIFVINLVLAPAMLFLVSCFMHKQADNTIDRVLLMEDKWLFEKNIVLVKTNLTHASLIKPIRHFYKQVMPEQVTVLANMQGRLSIERVSESGLKISRDIGFVSGFEQSYRYLEEYPYSVGDYIPINGNHLLVTEINAAGQPLEMEMYFNESLDDNDSMSFIYENNKSGFVKFDVPPIGQTISL